MQAQRHEGDRCLGGGHRQDCLPQFDRRAPVDRRDLAAGARHRSSICHSLLLRLRAGHASLGSLALRVAGGRGVIAILVALLICGGNGVSSPVAAAYFHTKAKQAILIDDATGAVLFQKDADVLVAPASMSKLMTLAVVFRALRSGEIKLTDSFTVSENAWRTGGAPSRTSSMFAGLGKDITVEDLIKGAAIQSGNDACIVLAEGLEGSEEKFAKRMEAEARRIGLKKSTFGNATGLENPRQLMTIREIAKLSRYIIRTYPEYYRYFGMRAFPYQPPGRSRPYAFFNRNPLLAIDIGADGLKTGHLDSVGYGLAASTMRNDQRLVAVVHGLESASDRKEEAVSLITWGYDTFDSYKVFSAGETVGQARVWGGEELYVPLQGDGDVRVLLPKGAEAKRLKFEVVYDGPLKPPIKAGEEVAKLRVTTANQSVNEVPLFAAKDVNEGSIVRQGLDSIAVLTLRWIGDQAKGLIEKVL